VVIPTTSADQTRVFGEALAGLVGPGDVVLLSGELGVGKTVLVQGIAGGLGVEEPVTSPTFALVDEHTSPSGLRLLHVDAYRLDDPAEIVELGLGEEVDDGRTVAVVEWGDKARAVLPGDRLEIDIAEGPGPDDRRCSCVLVGPAWEARRGRLHLIARRLADPEADGADGVLL
jgi:tRNA threonylcarbamoyladenosine biosynthesis protein TsaE